MKCIRPIFRREVTGLTPPEKFAQKFLGLPFVEHMQLKNVTVGVMNITVTITVGVKCAPEPRMHQNAPFWRRKYEKFSRGGARPLPHPAFIGEGVPPPRPHHCQRLHSSAFDTQAPPPNHISGYGPEMHLVCCTFVRAGLHALLLLEGNIPELWDVSISTKQNAVTC